MIYYISQHVKKSRWVLVLWTFGENACHPERSEGSGSRDGEILRCAQDDSQDSAQVLHGKSSLQTSVSAAAVVICCETEGPAQP